MAAWLGCRRLPQGHLLQGLDVSLQPVWGRPLCALCVLFQIYKRINDECIMHVSLVGRSGIAPGAAMTTPRLRLTSDSGPGDGRTILWSPPPRRGYPGFLDPSGIIAQCLGPMESTKRSQGDTPTRCELHTAAGARFGTGRSPVLRARVSRGFRRHASRNPCVTVAPFEL